MGKYEFYHAKIVEMLPCLGIAGHPNQSEIMIDLALYLDGQISNVLSDIEESPFEFTSYEPISNKM